MLITCTSIEYRQGWIEVTRDIHANSINLETSNVDASGSVTSNVELEMTYDEAQRLVDEISKVLNSYQNHTN